MCDDNMDIITVLRDVRDGFKTCAYYNNNNEIEDVINDTCLNRNLKLTGFFFYCTIVFIAMCE